MDLNPLLEFYRWTYICELSEALEAYRNGDSFTLGKKITYTANDIISLMLAAKVVRNTAKVAKAYGIDSKSILTISS